jgi:serine protease Do
LLELNGQPINVRFPEELAAARLRIASLPVDQNVTLLIKRGEETLTLTAKTEKLEGAVGEEREFKAWGLSLRDITRSYANDNQLDDDEGAVVTTITPGYPAAKAELQQGDVIRSINGEAITDLTALETIYDASVKKKEPRVLVEVLRNRGARTVLLKVTY